MNKWDDRQTWAEHDKRKVIQIQELQARREATKLVKQIFPNMNPKAASMVSGVLGIFMSTPTKEKP